MDVHRLPRGLPGALTFAHQAFELLAGSGIIGQRHVGLVPAAALAIAADAGCVAATADRDREWDRLLALAAATALAAPPLHYTLFPWRLRWGLPVLTEAEGLRGIREEAGRNPQWWNRAWRNQLP